MTDLFGTLPEGWLATTLRDLCTLQTGPSSSVISPPGAGNADPRGGVPVVKPRNIADHRVSLSDLGYVTEAEAQRLRRHRLVPGDVLVTRTGTVGRAAVVGEGQGGWLPGTQLVRLRALKEAGRRVSPNYLVSYLEADPAREWIRVRAVGSAIPYISAQTLGGLPVAVPPLPVQEEIGAALSSLDEKVRLHRRVAETTAKLRETLAILLLTGQVPADSGEGTAFDK
jgi:hypothetical protein